MAQESNLIIEVSTDNATWAPLTTLPANSTSHSHTGLTAGSLRYYRLKAAGNGSTILDSPWVYANATTNAAANTTPAAPTFTAFDDTNNLVTLEAKNGIPLSDYRYLLPNDATVYVVPNNGVISVGNITGSVTAYSIAATGRNQSPNGTSPAFTTSGPVDTEAPTVLQAYKVDSTHIAVQFSEPVTSSTASVQNTLAGYIFKINNFEIALTAIAGLNTDTLTFTVNTAINPTDSLTLTYQANNGDTRDLAGNLLASFIEIVVNQSAYYFRAEFTAPDGTAIAGYTPEVGTFGTLEGTAAINAGILKATTGGYATRQFIDFGTINANARIRVTGLNSGVDDQYLFYLDYTDENNYSRIQVNTNGTETITFYKFNVVGGVVTSVVLVEFTDSSYKYVDLLLKPNANGGMDAAILPNADTNLNAPVYFAITANHTSTVFVSRFGNTANGAGLDFIRFERV